MKNKANDLVVAMGIILLVVVMFYSFWLLVLILVGYVLYKSAGVKRKLMENGFSLEEATKYSKKYSYSRPKDFDKLVKKMNKKLNKVAKST